MNVSRRRLMIVGTGWVTAGNRLFGQGQELSFSLAPLELRDAATLQVAAFCSSPCRIDIALSGSETIRREMSGERTFSQMIQGVKSRKVDRRVTIIPSGPTVPRFAVIFEPGGGTPPSALEDQARRAPFKPQPVQPVHRVGAFLVTLESPADVAVEIRKAGSSNLVRFYRVTDRPQGNDVPVPWDLLDNSGRRVGPGLYASDLTLNWKNGLRNRARIISHLKERWCSSTLGGSCDG